MVPGVALPLVACMLEAASLDLQLGLRAEGRSTLLAPAGVPDYLRAGYSADPRATLRAEAASLRLTAAYAPRVWVSDARVQDSPFVSHTVSGLLETATEGARRVHVGAVAVRATTDPLADPWQRAAPVGGRAQVATTAPVDYEELRADAGATVPVGSRTTALAIATWNFSRSTELANRALLPLQRRLTLEGGLARLATERNSLRLSLRQQLIRTDDPGGTARTSTSTVLGTFRRRLTAYVDGWVGGGAAYTTFDHDPRPTPADPLPQDTEPAESDLLPEGEVGLARVGDVLALTGDVTLRVTTFVDGFTGNPTAFGELAGGLRWAPTTRFALAATATAGARPDRETVLARSDLRASWSPTPRLTLSLGATGRLQRERRSDLPSFVETGSIAAVTWMLRERLALELGVMARVHDEQRIPGGSFSERAAFAGFSYQTERLFRQDVR